MTAFTSSKSTMSSGIVGAVNYVAWILDELRPFIGRRILEIGTGYGTYRSCLMEVEAYYSLDIDPAAVADAARADPAGTYVCADIAKPGFTAVPAGAVDTVICANVLEHIDDHVAALDNMRRTVTGDGHVLLFVPAMPVLYSDMDRLAGHLRRYTLRSLTETARQAGLKPLRVRYFNCLGGLGWWLNAHRRYDDLDHREINVQIAVFDKYVLPISRALDPLTRRFFGQSVIGVFRP